MALNIFRKMFYLKNKEIYENIIIPEFYYAILRVYTQTRKYKIIKTILLDFTFVFIIF